MTQTVTKNQQHEVQCADEIRYDWRKKRYDWRKKRIVNHTISNTKFYTKPPFRSIFLFIWEHYKTETVYVHGPKFTKV